MNNPELPTWPGASAVYSKAYRLLERMAKWHYGGPYAARGRGLNVRPLMSVGVCPDDDTIHLIDALDSGNEEQIKGLLLQWSDR